MNSILPPFPACVVTRGVDEPPKLAVSDLILTNEERSNGDPMGRQLPLHLLALEFIILLPESMHFLDFVHRRAHHELSTGHLDQH